MCILPLVYFVTNSSFYRVSLSFTIPYRTVLYVQDVVDKSILPDESGAIKLKQPSQVRPFLPSQAGFRALHFLACFQFMYIISWSSVAKTALSYSLSLSPISALPPPPLRALTRISPLMCLAGRQGQIGFQCHGQGSVTVSPRLCPALRILM